MDFVANKTVFPPMSVLSEKQLQVKERKGKKRKHQRPEK